MIEPVTMWAVRNPDGRIIPSTVSFYAQYARERLVYIFAETSWKQLYRRGYRCVKVEVKELES